MCIGGLEDIFGTETRSASIYGLDPPLLVRRCYVTSEEALPCLFRNRARLAGSASCIVSATIPCGTCGTGASGEGGCGVLGLRCVGAGGVCGDLRSGCDVCVRLGCRHGRLCGHSALGRRCGARFCMRDGDFMVSPLAAVPLVASRCTKGRGMILVPNRLGPVVGGVENPLRDVPKFRVLRC